MAGLQEISGIVACGLRPEGGLVHLAALVGFVWLAWRVSPRRAPARGDRARCLPARGSRDRRPFARDARPREDPPRR